MLIRIADFLRPTNALKKKYKGVVVVNNDPKKLGRIKVKIEGLIVSDSNDNLPWCFPITPAGSGGTSEGGSFSVPDLGSELVIEFPYEDIYSPFYVGYWQSRDTHSGIFDEDYPNSSGWRDSQGTWFKTNRAKQYTEWKHSSNARIKMYRDSTIELRSRKQIKFVSEDGKTEFVFDMEKGSMDFNPKALMGLTSPVLNLVNKELNINAGVVKEKIAGSRETKVLSGHKLTIGGDDSKAVLGNHAESVAGDQSITVGGKTDVVHGKSYSETIVLGDKALKIMVGSYITQLLAGDIDMSTLMGLAKLGNAIGKLEISKTGGIELSNPMGKIEVSPAGSISIKNNLAKITISPAGQISIDAPTQLEAKGKAMSTFGSGSGITQLQGSMVMIAGGGAPVARMGDMVMGIGNLGAPVVSNIMLGSFKVLCG